MPDNGHLHSRPMTTQKPRARPPHRYFFASRSTEPVLDAAGEPSINVSHADPDVALLAVVIKHAKCRATEACALGPRTPRTGCSTRRDGRA